jgi:UDP-glucose 4-epimerase
VSEVFATVREVTGIDFTVDVVGRRAGDPAAYFADATRSARSSAGPHGWTSPTCPQRLEAWQQRG